MFGRRSLITIALAGAAASNALAQDQAIVGIQTVTTYNADERITAVDAAARTVTVSYPDGATRTVNVSPGVANFSSTRVGDSVTIDFQDRRTFVLSGRNTPVPQARDRSVTTAAASGQNLAGVSASKSIANWWVVSVDPAGNTITLVSPDGGPVRTFNVTDPANRAQLSRVKVGDSVTDINSSLLAMSITPKA